MDQGRLRRLAEYGARSFVERLVLLLLTPFGWLYGLLGLVRVALYRCGIFSTYRAGVPVIAVGNLTLGGTGKTPLVDHLIKELQARGERVAVVSRGYKGTGRGEVTLVGAGTGTEPLVDANLCGDEPFLLARRNPGAIVITAPRRRHGVAAAEIEHGATVVILDDAFQHLAVARDLNLLLLDARQPFGNGRVLPAGLLREFPGQMGRADLILRTRVDITSPPFTPSTDHAVIDCRHTLDEQLYDLHGNAVPCAALQKGRPIAFAGIAQPERFFAALAQHGLSPATTLPLPDHVDFNEATIRRINDLAQAGDFFVTTEKDGVKLRREQLSLPCYQVRLKLHFTPETLLGSELDRILSRR